MKYPFTAAIIGTGRMGKRHLAVLHKLVENIVVCGNDEESAKALAEEYGCKYYLDYAEMFATEALDFVSVCVPTPVHHPITMKALECGINVLCEKPFASSVAEAAEMVEYAKEKDLLLMVGHSARFSKQFEYLKKCVRDNRFGRILSYSASREGGVPSWASWLADLAQSGGALRDSHIHDTDIILNLFGMPKSIVTVGTPNVCRTVYKYGNVSVSASASWRNIKNLPGNRSFEVLFEKALVEDKGNVVTVYTETDSFSPLETEEFSEFFENSTTENETRYFCHCLQNKERPLLCLPEDSLKTMMINAAEFESLEKDAEIFL